MLSSLKINKPESPELVKTLFLWPQPRAYTGVWLIGSLLVLCNLLSCNDSGQPDKKLLAEAYRYHEQALQQSSKLQSRLLGLESRISALQTPQDSYAFREKIKGCRQDLLELEMNVTEVPGYEHGNGSNDEDQHKHHHHHGHKRRTPCLCPEQHLKVQQAYLQATEEILFTTDSLTTALQQLINLQENNSEE